MGWYGYGLYCGDETQTLHLNIIKKAIPKISKDEIYSFLNMNKTIIPNDLIKDFRKGIPKIMKMKRSKKYSSWDEYDAIDWQMLLSLFVDNNLSVPTDVLVYGILASKWLIKNQANDFDEPKKRISYLKRFISKVNKDFLTVKAAKKLHSFEKKYNDINS